MSTRKEGREMSSPTLNEIKQQVMLLSEEDRKDLTTFLLAQADANNGAQTEPRDFSRDMEWIRHNSQSYRGQFVSLKEGQLLAHGSKEREVWQAAVSAGISNPFLAYIETEAEATFGGW
jgi:hypothetical protein